MASATRRADNYRHRPVITIASIAISFALTIATNEDSYAQNYQSVPVLKGNPDTGGIPVIENVESTPLGYVITGRGFGSNPESVRILENDSPLSESAVVGVSSQRISVLSVPSVSTSIVVEVDGTASAALQFEYVRPSEPPMSDMPVGDAPEDAEITTANVSMLRAGEPDSENSPDNANTDAQTTGEPALTDTSQAESSATVSANMPASTVPGTDLDREVMILRKRLESLEEEIYQLRKLIVEDSQ